MRRIGISLVAAFAVCALLASALFVTGCSKPRSALAFSGADSARILSETLSYRSAADAFFRSDPASPFQNDPSAHFDGIKWFPPDVGWYFRVPLHRYPSSVPVTVFGTKGEARKQIRYGYFVFDAGGEEIRLNVYKADPSDPENRDRYGNELSVWFTDATTGKETYEVGRYLDIGEEQTDPGALYALNFNNAYNPYCSYSAHYSCAIPTKEDRLNVAVRAGERKYHP